MKIIIISLLMGFSGLLTISCESKKTRVLTESEFLTDSIYSEPLAEYRKYNIYLPKDFSKGKKYRIIYATDGNSDVTDNKKLFDSLVDNEIIKPLIFVASFSNTKIVDSIGKTFSDGKKYILTYRYYEYVQQISSVDSADILLEERFENHMQYFTEELIPHIEEKYNQNHTKKDRYFYGISNGAGFGLSLLNQKPNSIGTFICFSNVGAKVQSYNWNSNIIYPSLYYRYGSDEAPYLKEDAEFLKSKYLELNSSIETKEYQGWHNNEFWKEEFIEVISKLLN